MKKIFLGLALSFSTLSFAQQYPNNGWNDYENQGGNYGYDDDQENYFPDDYYYDYPQDYYPQDYYQSYYNDYRNSIVNINWNGFFNQNRLNQWQIRQILRLNNLYVNFSTWNNFYRYNPDRWYYDRFYALERILGPRVFVVFQNNYYQNRSPIAYFQDYRRTYYGPRFRVMPRYRSVNINIYRVDRNKFRRQDNPTINIVRSTRDNGFRNENNNSNGGGFRNQNNAEIVKSNNGFRSNNGNRNNDVRANNGNFGRRDNENSGGFRNNNRENQRNVTPPRSDNGSRGEGGFRNGNRSENSGSRMQNSQPQRQNNNNQGRGGMRNGFASN